MVGKQKILKIIENEYQQNKENSGSKLLNLVANRVYQHLPDDNKELIELFDFLVSTGEWSLFWLVTEWIKRKRLYKLKNIRYYENWLYNHVDSWGKCDVFCYRVLNPMVEKHPELFENVMKWTESSKTYVRRAAPVSLINSGRGFSINVSIERVIKIAEKLKHDDELHVQKGVGWLLKYAYLSYPEEIYDYLKNNVDNLPRVIFRYALEKTPKDIKKELMSL
ncbi:MAG: DNA alkylation repair protein [Thermoplasmatota archaeon]